MRADAGIGCRADPASRRPLPLRQFRSIEGGNPQLACDPAQRPTAAHQKGYRFPLELIRKMTPSLAHSTPFCSRRGLAKVSTISSEPHFAVQRFAPTMRYAPSAVGRILGRAVEAFPTTEDT
jgi:hypothetical protein